MTDIPFPEAATPPKVALPPQQPPRDVLTPGMIEALAKTKPWVRFIAVLCYIGVALMGIGGVVMMAVGIFQMTSKGAEGAAVLGLGVLYLAMGILYIFPSRYLSRYAASIGDALEAPSKTYAVEQALKHQKSFWKFAGIMSLIMILLYIPGIIAAIAIPNFLTAMQRSKQKRTMADMRAIASAIEARATDTHDVPANATIDDLATLLEPKYIRTLPRMDGWGNRFVYEATECETGRCESYLIASPASDKKFERDDPSAWIPSGKTETKTFDDDIVMANGAFLRAPEAR